MEPAGLAVGVVGLVGLFNACLETVARIDAYREFGLDSRSLAAQFQANKLLFERWGRAIGLDEGQLSSCYHPGLDDEAVRSVVAEIITMIQGICSGTGSAGPQRAPEEAAASKSFSLTRRPTLPTAGSATKRQKLVWSLRGKEKRIAEVEKLDNLVRKLYELVPIETEESRKVQEAHMANFSRLGNPKGMIDSESWIKEIQETLRQIEKDIEAETRRELHAWIRGDISGDLYHDLKETRVPGTCDWILERDEFRDWLRPEKSSSVLWVTATAGFGKTVLCARVIEYLCETLNTPVAHFFISSKNASRDDPYLAIRSWILQLMADDARAFKLVQAKRLSQHEQIANRTTIIAIFQEIVRYLPECTFVLDGLDECTWVDLSHQKNDSIKTFLRLIGEAVEGSAGRLMLVSRNDESIRNALRDTLVKSFDEIRMMVDDVYEDIVSYSKTIVDERLSNKPPDFRDDISQRIANQCDGQFLWVRLQANKLRKVSNRFQIRKDISNAPAGLEQLYEREWESIRTNPDLDTERALSLLKWAAFSVRPLSVSEISVAVLIKRGCLGVPIEELPDVDDGLYIIEDIKAHCGSLLDIKAKDENKNDNDIRLMEVNITHFSVKQFILSSISISDVSLGINSGIFVSYEQRQHDVLAEACLQYIFPLGVWKTKGLSEDEHGLEIAFLDYAASAWYVHICSGSEDNTELSDLANRFFEDQTGVFDEWRRWIHQLFYRRDAIRSIPDEDDQLNRLSYSISLKISKATDHLLAQESCEINTRGCCGETPLSASCRTGEVQIVNRLLSRGASLSLSGRGSHMPLCIAAQHGYMEVIKGLLDAGADINIQDDSEAGRTPLIWASSQGHLDMVNFLLENGADIGLSDKFGNSPLIPAVQEGYLQVTQILLDKGANVGVTNTKGEQPLGIACRSGNLALVRLLLQKGADVLCMTMRGTALHNAAMGGHREVAKLLLDQGAQIDCFDQAEMTPTCYSVVAGHLELTELLIERGSNMTIRQRGEESSLLHEAAGAGQLGITRLLCEKEPDLILARNRIGDSPLISAISGQNLELTRYLVEKESKLISEADNEGWTPLHTAVTMGHLEICQFLLQNEASLSCEISQGSNPLHLATHAGHFEIVKLLLEKGSDPTVQEKNGWTPLYTAACNGHCEIVKLLLEKGSDPTVQGKDGWTPLLAAASNGHFEIIRLLLETVSYPTIQKNSVWTPLYVAAEKGHLDIVKLLLEKGPDPTIRGDTRWTPLHIAAFNGHFDIVKLLLEKGSDPTIQDKNGWNTLYNAAYNGHFEIVKLLLEKGSDPTVQDKNGWTPLNTAAYNGHFETAKLLLEKGPESNIANIFGTTPFSSACASGCTELVNFLLDQPGIDWNARDLAGRTPLSRAARCGQIEVVEILTSRNLDSRVDTLDVFGYTPLFNALRNDHGKIVEILLPKTSDWKDWKDIFGRNLIWWARHIGSSRITQFLIDSGAEVDSPAPIQGDATNMSSQPRPFDRTTGCCDRCIGSLRRGEEFYSCKIRIGGDFDLCIDCFDLGLRCLDNSHSLIHQEADEKIAEHQ